MSEPFTGLLRVTHGAFGIEAGAIIQLDRRPPRLGQVVAFRRDRRWRLGRVAGFLRGVADVEGIDGEVRKVRWNRSPRAVVGAFYSFEPNALASTCPEVA